MTRCLIISDCHGQPHLIENALAHAGYQKGKDRLIFCGDLLDIGPDPLECYTILKEEGAELLWGNHDLAIILRKTIHPQSEYDIPVYEVLISDQASWKVAACQDDVLITHAGLSEYFYQNMFDTDMDRAEQICTELNKMPLDFMWSNESPLWYRPSDMFLPKTDLVQVAGHTPPGYFKRTFRDFYFTDPYCQVGFNKNRYRYALIEDNIVKIFDSNDKNL